MIVGIGKGHEQIVVFPPAAEDLNELLDFSDKLEGSASYALLLGEDGHEIPIPERVYELLVRVVGALTQGRAVTLSLIDTKLTTQEAADFLGISRPTLIKLLDKGKIPYEKMPESRHRRILLTDLLDYQEVHKRRQAEILDYLIEDAEDAGLYDENG